MGCYFKKGKGWRYDFIHLGNRFTGAWFRTKADAMREMALKKEVVTTSRTIQEVQEAQTDMDFLEVINRRLDYVKAYHSATHYRDYVYMAKRWARLWGHLKCDQITQDMVEQYLLKRRRQVTAYTVNHDLRYLRAAFNWARRKKLIGENPTEGIAFLPVEKKVKYVPSPEDIYKVIARADADTQDYLWLILHTMGRVSEINRLEWKDVDLVNRRITLFTRKKRGGHLTPRLVPMTDRVHKILSRRFSRRDETKPWVFWHTYWSSKTGDKKEGPYQERKRIMRTLCQQAGVKYFRFHALRHAGASIMDRGNVPIGTIQKILGHENRRTTEIYLHSIGRVEREAVAFLEAETEKVTHRVTHSKEKGLRLVS